MINFIFTLFLLVLIIIFINLIYKKENFQDSNTRCRLPGSCFGKYNHSIVDENDSSCLNTCLVEHSRNIEYRIDRPKDKIFDYSYKHKIGSKKLKEDDTFTFNWDNAPKTNKLISEIGITSIDNERTLNSDDSKFSDGWEFVTNKQPIISSDGTEKFLVVKKVPYLYDAITEEGPIWEDKKIKYITNIHIAYGLNGTDISNDDNISEVKTDDDDIKHIGVIEGIKIYIYPEIGSHENNDQPLLDLKFSDDDEQKEGFSIVTKAFLINNETDFPVNNTELGYKCSNVNICSDQLNLECLPIENETNIIYKKDDEVLNICNLQTRYRNNNIYDTHYNNPTKRLFLFSKQRHPDSINILDREFISNRKLTGYCFEHTDPDICSRDLRCSSDEDDSILVNYRSSEQNLKEQGGDIVPLRLIDEDIPNIYPICIEKHTNLLSGPCSINKSKCNKCIEKYDANLQTLLNKTIEDECK